MLVKPSQMTSGLRMKEIILPTAEHLSGKLGTHLLFMALRGLECFQEALSSL